MGDDVSINTTDNIILAKKFYVNRSRCMAVFLVFIYGGALVCSLLLPFTWLIKAFLWLFCLVAFLYQYQRRILFVGKKVFVALAYLGNGRWELYGKNHQCFPARIQKSSVLLPLCALLHFRVEDEDGLPMCKRKLRYKNNFAAVVIFYDAMPKEDFRQLRVLALTAR